METVIPSNVLVQQPCPWFAQVGAGLARVHDRMANACAKAQRATADVQLVAVSKTKPAQAVWAAVQHGHTLFGENRVQEALAKMQQVQAWLGPQQSNPAAPADAAPAHLPQVAGQAKGQVAERGMGQVVERGTGQAKGQVAERGMGQVVERGNERGTGQVAEQAVEWHMIGHVQTNKAKQLGQGFGLLHALDSQRLAAALHKVMVTQAGSTRLPVLLQVNYSAEKSKAGVEDWEALQRLTEALMPLPTLYLRGLMCIPPPGLGEKATRKVFAQVRCSAEKLRQRFCLGAGFATLSMGMSADLEWAIAEGATLVRVGQAIFGSRTE